MSKVKVPHAELSFGHHGNNLVIYHQHDPSRVALTMRVAHELGPGDSYEVKDTSANSISLEWAKVSLKLVYQPEDGAQRYDVEWTALSDAYTQIDSALVGTDHWYGGPSVLTQHWPVQKQTMPMHQYLPGDPLAGDPVGGTLESYWLSSAGAAVYVDDKTPLHFSSNEQELCFKATFAMSDYSKERMNGGRTVLKYTICVKDNIRDLHLHMMGRYIDKPQGLPDERMFHDPIWSTWAQYKMHITQDIVLEFANKIRSLGLPACQIEIDDMYTPTYGDFIWDQKKFPNPKEMIQKIHDMGFRVTSWIIPFADANSAAYQEGLKKDYFVKDAEGKVGKIKWWQNSGAGLIDFTNPQAKEWFIERLGHLRKDGIDSFKFDAGELNWPPKKFNTLKPLHNPCEYTKTYIEACLEAAPDRMLEVRVGYKTQRLPVWDRMLDKLSHWGYDMGLKSVIPSLLQFGIIGYQFCLPDMIGGNAYSTHEDGNFGNHLIGDKPKQELYIRWMQLNALMPAVQISVVPWIYDDATIKVTKECLELHKKYAPKFITLAKDSMKTGAPIVRPLWWLDPKDHISFTIDDEFLVGDDLLVAPIVDEGARARDIYLPVGQWKDMLRGGVHQGKQTLKDYKVDLYELAYFERVSA